jgi:hypothetical protein
MYTQINIQIQWNVDIMQRVKKAETRTHTRSSAKNVKILIGQEEISREKTFKYLGRIINESDDDLPAVETQLKKGRQVQTILIYRSESWVLTQFILDKFNTYHHMCARYVLGRHTT